MQFISLIHASLVVIVVASIVCRSDAISPVNTATFFGNCSNFAIMAGSAVAFNGALTNVTNGNVGTSPGTSIAGSYTLVAGSLESNSAAAVNCAASDLAAYQFLQGLTCTTQNTLPSSDLAGLTLTSGVYCSAPGTFVISASTLTLNGSGDPNSQFIFQTATTLTTSTATSFVLINGAQAKNVFWQIGSSATLGLSSSFVGHILTGATINVGHTTTVVGKLLAQVAVNFAGIDTVSPPS